MPVASADPLAADFEALLVGGSHHLADLLGRDALPAALPPRAAAEIGQRRKSPPASSRPNFAGWWRKISESNLLHLPAFRAVIASKLPHAFHGMKGQALVSAHGNVGIDAQAGDPAVEVGRRRPQVLLLRWEAGVALEAQQFGVKAHPKWVIRTTRSSACARARKVTCWRAAS